MATIQELLGSQSEILENERVEYERLLKLLQDVLVGTIDSQHVSVDLNSKTWKVEIPTKETIPSFFDVHRMANLNGKLPNEEP